MTDVKCGSQRAEFEHWMIHSAKVIVGSSDPYPAGLERDYWRVWQAAWQSSRASMPAIRERSATDGKEGET